MRDNRVIYYDLVNLLLFPAAPADLLSQMARSSAGLAMNDGCWFLAPDIAQRVGMTGTNPSEQIGEHFVRVDPSVAPGCAEFGPIGPWLNREGRR